MRTLIIAEAGVNHNGSLKIAKQLALTARQCGADIVKFQTAKLDSVVSKYADMAEYQKNNIGREMCQKEMLKRLLLTYDEFIELAAYCDEIGIEFLSTPFDLESIEFLGKLGCSIWKIPSGEITNLPYLEKIAKTHKKIILSTGMSTLEEVKEAIAVLEQNNAGEIIILHCTTQYPASVEEINLNAMCTLRSVFHKDIGYSDHTRGIEVSIAAVAMGAVVIEKHFTLDRQMAGPDHKASLEPDELHAMIRAIRNIEKALGTGEKKPTESENANKAVARKSIIATCNISKGEFLTKDNITTKRPGTGISPMYWYKVLGTRAIRDFQEDELIEI
ncbi:N-acetylneuraminate synthase [Lachnospiraceae bacterium 56-18]|jgi:N,N'-diacetyllegionaminate synthase